MSRFSTIPTFDQTLTDKGVTNRVWYFFWQSLYKGNPPGAESTLTVTQSPFTFVAAQRGFVIVQGGTVSMIQFSRGGVQNYNTGATTGVFPLSAGDSLIVTYSGIPAMTFVPQ